LSDAQEQSKRLIAEARDVAARLHEQERQRASVSAEQIIRAARDAAAQERTRMLGEVRRDVGRLVVQTTAAVIGTVLTPADQQRLAEETGRRLSAS
jgi:F-type H+-transporting ATPase subunit b